MYIIEKFNMKKLLGIVVLGLLWSNVGFAANLKSLENYLQENKNYGGDLTVLSYLTSRCAAFYNFSATITYQQDKDLSDRFVKLATEMNMLAMKALMKKLNNNSDDAASTVMANVKKMTEYYMKDGKDNFTRTGSYVQGSYIEGDAVICNQTYETLFK